MRPQESFLGQPIRDLQSMLRVIAKAANRELNLIPDGIYADRTADAVADFQREHSLPVTGITDLDTWEAVLSAYEPAIIGITPAYPLHIQLNFNQVIGAGENHPHIYLVQAMLAVLSKEYSSIPLPGFSGTVDKATGASLKAFQSLCSLKQTGELDKITWKCLALQYPLAAALQSAQPKETGR